MTYKASQIQLQAAVKEALWYLQSQWLAAKPAAACILLLGAASKGKAYYCMALLVAAGLHTGPRTYVEEARALASLHQ